MTTQDPALFVRVAVLSAGLLLPVLWRAHPTTRNAGLFASLFGGVALVVAWHLGPNVVPTEWITFLKEGQEEAILHSLWIRDAWLGLAFPGEVLPLRATVFAHLLEAVAAVVVLVPVARSFLPPAGALTVLALAVLNPWFINASISEGFAIPLLFLAAVTALAAGVPGDAPLAVRGVATASLASAAIAATELRFETALVSVPVLIALLAGWWAVGPTRWVNRHLARVPRAGIAVALLLSTTAALGVMHLADGWMPGTTSVRVGAPWTSTGWHDLRLPIDLLAYTSPGFALLVVLGLFAARDLRTLALAFGTLLSARVYTEASHFGAAPYETLRYMAMLLGPMTLLALHGATELERVGRLRPAWPVVAILGLLVPRVLAAPSLQGPPWLQAQSIQQLGARFIVQTVEANPGCLLMTRLRTRVPINSDDEATHPGDFTTATYGWQVGMASPRMGGDDAARADCVLFVTALDCNLLGADCAAQVAGLEPLSRHEIVAPESNVHHGRRAVPTIFMVSRVK